MSRRKVAIAAGRRRSVQGQGKRTRVVCDELRAECVQGLVGPAVIAGGVDALPRPGMADTELDVVALPNEALRTSFFGIIVEPALGEVAEPLAVAWADAPPALDHKAAVPGSHMIRNGDGRRHVALVADSKPEGLSP